MRIQCLDPSVDRFIYKQYKIVNDTSDEFSIHPSSKQEKKEKHQNKINSKARIDLVVSNLKKFLVCQIHFSVDTTTTPHQAPLADGGQTKTSTSGALGMRSGPTPCKLSLIRRSSVDKRTNTKLD